jgi:glycosyltransferase involved in cell wall biosynthesis
MNILLINHYAGSTEMGMEFRPFYLAQEWVKQGHEVTIVAGDYSHLRLKNPVVEQDFQQEEIGGVRYIWFKTGFYEGNGMKRALTMLRFVRKLYRYGKKISKLAKPDVVIASSTYPLDAYAAHFIARKTGAKVIHEVHDMWPSTLVELGGMSRRHPFVVMMQIGENYAYRHADYVVSLPSCAESYMKEHGLREGGFACVRNGVVLSDWEDPQPLPEKHLQILTELKKDKFVVGYFGGHALSNALDLLLDAAKALKNPNIHIVLVGDGVEKKRLQKRAEEERISNVTFLDPIPKKAVPSLVSYFDCTYLGALDSPLYRFGICMNKIFDSMMAGKPMVCAIQTPDTLIPENKCGVMVDPGDLQNVVNALEEMANTSPEALAEMGENGRKAAVEKYNYTALARQFAALFATKE